MKGLCTHDVRDIVTMARAISKKIGPPDEWVPCRPLSGSPIDRIGAAWLVLIGRADAVTWPGQ